MSLSGLQPTFPKLGNTCWFVQSLASPVVHVFLLTNNRLCARLRGRASVRGLTCALCPPYPEEGAAIISHCRKGRWRELVLFAHSYGDGDEARLEFKPKSSGLEAWHLASMRWGPRDHPDLDSKSSLPPPTLMLAVGMGKQT